MTRALEILLETLIKTPYLWALWMGMCCILFGLALCPIVDED